uniref:Uncharacterized protein n=1 Tax=viral metagenome TaxID=1070528 RepID=A0A6M3KPH8_9ZZZZ
MTRDELMVLVSDEMDMRYTASERWLFSPVPVLLDVLEREGLLDPRPRLLDELRRRAAAIGMQLTPVDRKQERLQADAARALASVRPS